TELRAEQAETATTMNLFDMPQFFAAIPVVVYIIDVCEGNHRAIWVSSNIPDIIGYPVDVALEPGWWEQHLHPEYREQNLAEFRDVLAHKGGSHAYRFRHGNGSYVFIKDELRLISNPDRQTRRYIGVWTDISESHRAEEEILQYSKQLEHAMFDTVNSIARLSELRDPYTSGHERRVGEMGSAIAAEMGLDQHTCMGLRIAGLLHDIGKVAVPAEILVQPARLSATEYALVQEHAEYGYSILKDVTFPWPVARVAREHHERINGSGYPQGLKGDEISLEARIIAVADVIESMASHRPYRPGLGITQALEEIERGSGTLK
ncbi:MAG TPA: HD domain-containing phosphohydrolase, partial [Kineobactrum sp.]